MCPPDCPICSPLIHGIGRADDDRKAEQEDAMLKEFAAMSREEWEQLLKDCE